MANLLKAKREVSSGQTFIPTLLEQKPDGIYVNAFCPLCDKAEKSKVQHPGQTRDEAASVARIRAHIRERHGKVAI
jgi:hypothetical protein